MITNAVHLLHHTEPSQVKRNEVWDAKSWSTIGPRWNSRHSRPVRHSHSRQTKTKPRCEQRYIRWHRDARLRREDPLRLRIHDTTPIARTSALRLRETDEVHVIWLHHIACAIPMVCISVESIPHHETKCHGASATEGVLRSADLRTCWWVI